MILTPKLKLILGAAGLALLVYAWILRGQWAADNERLKQQVAFSEQAIKEAKAENEMAQQRAQEQIAASEQSAAAARRLAEIAQSNLASRLAALDRQINAPKTATELVNQIQQEVPGLPDEITLNIPPPTAANPKPEPISATMSVADFKVLSDRLLEGEKTLARLEAAEAQGKAQADEFAALKSGMEAKLDAAAATIESQKEQLAATEKERDEWKRMAQGGSFWQRAGRALKWTGIGIGIGIAIGHGAF